MSAAERAGFSSARLRTLDGALARYVETGALPGTLVQIWRRGEFAHTAMTGSMDMERARPMREDAIFRIYSMTKPVTIVALMMLVEEGRVDLDDEVSRYIPSFAGLGVFTAGTRGSFSTRPPERPMRVIDLVTHTSGLTYGFVNRTNVDAAYRELGIGNRDTAGGTKAMVEQLAALPLEFSPGSAWNYSVSTDVAGHLVEVISGQSLGAFFAERIFARLGMVDTGFFCPAGKLDRLTSCYQATGDGGLALQDDGGASVYAAAPALESGGGGLVSTAADYMRFCRMLLAGGALGEVRLLSPKTVALFSLNHLPGNADIAAMSVVRGLFNESGYSGVGFSLGCSVTIDVARTRLPGSVGEYAWGGAAATAFWIDPKEDLAVVFMTQVIGTPHRIALRRRLRTLVYAAMTETGSRPG